MSDMTATDAVNVLKFLERLRATENNPEGFSMLLRVETHLRDWVSKATSEQINDGGPAFPSNRDMRHNPDWNHEPGMSLRDYMAVHASENDIRNQGEVIRSEQVRNGDIGILPDGWQVIARYMHADAMLKAREGVK